MAKRLYLDERNLRSLGMTDPNVRTLRALMEFVDTQQQLAAAQATLSTQGDAIDAANTSIATANDAINANDARLDAIEALQPFVRQDQAAAPSFTAFAGQTISDPPTQAEVQAIDDAVAAVGSALEDLITALQSAEVLT